MSDSTENTWTVHYDEDGDFPKFFNSLKEHERAAVILTIENILTPLGINICQTEWGKALGQGLYEIRIRHSVKNLKNLARNSGSELTLNAGENSPVLLRVFCTFHGKKIVLLLGGYNKQRDSSKKRQETEIKRARKALKVWKAKQ